jgi:hypothetical protein
MQERWAKRREGCGSAHIRAIAKGRTASKLHELRVGGCRLQHAALCVCVRVWLRPERLRGTEKRFR